MNTDGVLESIRNTARRVLPVGSTLYLYGSHARGDFHPDSDWDLLLLLDKANIEKGDFEKYSYPFIEMGYMLKMVEQDMLSAAANRLYYSLFHAMSALLISDGHNIKGHHG